MIGEGYELLPQRVHSGESTVQANDSGEVEGNNRVAKNVTQMP